MAKKHKKLIVKDSRRTLLRLALLLLSVLLLAGVTIAVVFIVKGCGVMLSTRAMPFDSSSLHTGTGDGILYLRGSELKFLSFKDEDLNYSMPINYQPEAIVGTPGVKAVYTSDAVQILGKQFDTPVSGTIVKVCCGDNHAAVYSRLANGAYELRIFNAAGQQVLQLPSRDGLDAYPEGVLMDFGFSEADGKVFWTMELDTDSGTPRTTITTYDLARKTNTGIISVQGQLVERVFFTKESIFAVGTESMIRYSASDNREKYRVQIYGYRAEDISLSGSGPILLLVPRDGSAGNTARLLKVSEKDVAGEVSVTVLLPEDTVGCCMVNGMLAAVTKDGVAVYDAKGELQERLKFNALAITSCEKLDEHHLLLERSGELTLLTVGK